VSGLGAFGADATVAEGFRAIVAAELAGLAAQMPAARAGEMEGVHQMRVALRRLRACLVLFAPHLRRAEAAEFNDALRALGRVLGAARDWDVFCVETLPAALGGEAEELFGRASMERAAAHRRLVEVLEGPEPAALSARLAAWSGAEGTLARGAAGRRLVDAAGDLLDRLARKVRRRSRHVGRLDGEELHDLRKALKKLRYGVDFVGGLFEAKAVRRYEKGCKHLQEVLGRSTTRRRRRRWPRGSMAPAWGG
jgi:CHAD domain-containing protein